MCCVLPMVFPLLIFFKRRVDEFGKYLITFFANTSYTQNLLCRKSRQYTATLGFISRRGLAFGGPIDLHNSIPKLCQLKFYDLEGLWDLKTGALEIPTPANTSKPLYSDSDSSGCFSSQPCFPFEFFHWDSTSNDYFVSSHRTHVSNIISEELFIDDLLNC